MLILLLSLTALFILVVTEYDWKGAFLFTILVGFLQDPIRKISTVDSSYFAALSLIFFIITFLLIKSNYRGWGLRLICWPNPIIISLLPIFFYMLFLQSLNSFARFNDIRLTLVGLGFYIIPLISVWVGFYIANDLAFLKRALMLYIFLCVVFAITILMSLAGVDSSLLKEVGTGIQITGTGYGLSGLWRTSEIAGWHLAAGACFSFILGMSETRTLRQILFFLISFGLTFSTIATGRRKALGLVIIFVSLFLLYYAINSKGNKFNRALGSLVCVLAICLSSYGLIFSSEVQNKLEPFFSRSSTLTIEESQDRFRVQGLGSFFRGVQVAGPFGYGVGVGSNSGNTGIGESRSNIQSIGYISEGGGGRLILELGIIGVALVGYIAFQLTLLYIRIFSFSRHFTTISSDILAGLSLFALANVVTFLSASQLYSDPFVLIILGLSLGAILAVPRLILRLKGHYQYG